MLFLQLVINGLAAGALYALMAVGFAMIYNGTRILHLAHGAVFTFGGYMLYVLAVRLSLPVALAVIGVGAGGYELLRRRTAHSELVARYPDEPSAADAEVIERNVGKWHSGEAALLTALGSLPAPPSAGGACDVTIEHALHIDAVTGRQNETAIPNGDYGQFYTQLRDALNGAGPNPVRPSQALAVTAVVETAVRSSSERRAMPLPLTASEARDFAA